MSDWLKMLGSFERPCREDYALTHNYVRFRNCEPRGITPRDRMILYACGGEHLVFALAEVTSEVKDSGQVDWPFQVDITYTVKLPVSSGVPITQINTPGGRDLLDAIRTGHSYIRLRPEEYERAAALLVAARATHAAVG